MVKWGVLLVNLGSPESPSVRDVRRYLHQFLMDPRVLDVPYVLRKYIVCTQILPHRPATTAQAYQAIWTADGSPLITISRKVQRLLEERVQVPVALGMRYGHPSIAEALQELVRDVRGIQEILLIPLYPHYAMSSYETVVVEVKKQLQQLAAQNLSLQVMPPFFDRAEYIFALVESTREFLQRGYDHVLLSFHGLPERHLRKSDSTGNHCLRAPACCEHPSPAHDTCYRAQVFRSATAFVQAANIPAEKYSIAFQSRLGKEPWIQPYTDEMLPLLGKKGVKNLLVMCPTFVADCLETLEEIGIRGREAFLAAGGEYFSLIPCLNTHPRWIDALAAWSKTIIST